MTAPDPAPPPDDQTQPFVETPAAPRADLAADDTPTAVGPYRVVKELGRGGMGAVYLAEDPALQRRVALKVMRPDLARRPDAKERFLREARTMAAVKHDHIATIYAVGEADGTAFLAMELLEGTPLDRWLAKNPRPKAGVAVRVAKEVCRGLAAAHAKGLVHRDVKPGNVWLEAPKGRVKLLDFGLARATDDDQHLTGSGTVVGTPAYMAPEQARAAAVDGRTDLWSVGVLLYRMLAGRLPFEAPTTISLMAKLALDEPTPVGQLAPDAPPALAALVMRLLSKEPAGRPATAAAAAEELLAIERQLVAGPAATPAPPPVPAAKPRRKWIVAGAAAFTALAVLGGVVATVASKGDRVERVVRGEPNDTDVSTRPPTAAERQRIAAAALGVEPFVTGPRGLRLALIPAGEFLMGDPDGLPPPKDRPEPASTPRHRVRLTRPFYAGVHEVTVGQFRAFVEATGYRTVAETTDGAFTFSKDQGKLVQDPAMTWRTPGYPVADDLPVSCVSYDDAAAYCRWLSAAEGETYRLPTEAEWEYAARAGVETVYPWGDDEAAGKLPIAAKWGGGTRAGPVAVGTYPANAWGLYDVLGNGYEFVGDAPRTYGADVVIDPSSPLAAGAKAMARGGGWNTGVPSWLRLGYRGDLTGRGIAYHAMGFRVVRAVGPPAATAARIDLLAAADPAAGAVAGRWERTADGLAGVVAGRPFVAFEFPAVPPAEYDFEVEFTRPPDKNVGLLFVAAGRPCRWNLWATNSLRHFGFETVDGKLLDRPGHPASVARDIPATDRVVARVEVRRGGVAGFVNGERLVAFDAPDRLGVFDKYPRRDPPRLGVGHFDARVVYHRAELIPHGDAAPADPFAAAPSLTPTATLPGHAANVRRVAFSPDGATLASGGFDGVVIVRDAATGAVRRRIDAVPGGRVEGLAWLDAATLAVGAFKANDRAAGGLTVYDAATGRAVGGPVREFVGGVAAAGGGLVAGAYGPVRPGGDAPVWRYDWPGLAPRPPLAGHRGGVFEIAVSADGATVATAGGHEVRVWDAATGAERHRIATPGGESPHVGYAGGRLLVGLPDRTLTAYGPDGREAARVTLPVRPRGIAGLPGGRALVACQGPTGYVLDAATLAPLARLDGPAGGWGVAASPDGATAAVAHPTGDVTLWRLPPAAAAFPPLDAAWAAKVRTLPPDEQAKEVGAELKRRNPAWVGFVDARSWGVEGGAVTELTARGVGLRDLTPVRALPGLRQLNCNSSATPKAGEGAVADLTPLAGLPLERLMLNGNPVADLAPLRGMRLTDLLVRHTRVADLSPLATMPLVNLSITLPLTAEGAAAVAAIPTLGTVGDKPAATAIAEARELAALPAVLPLATPAGGAGVEALALAYSPDGRTLAVAGFADLVARWDVAGRRPLPGVGGPAKRIEWSHDGRHLMATPLFNPNDRLRRWAAATGEAGEAWQLPGAGGGIAVAPGGGEVAVGCGRWKSDEPSTVARFRWPGGEPLPPLPVPGGRGQVGHVAYSPDGRLLAAFAERSAAVAVWDATTGRVRHELTPGRKLSGFAFAPAGDRVAVVGDGRVTVFDAATGAAAVTGEVAATAVIAFVGDGRLVVGGATGTVLALDAATLRPVARYDGHRAAVNTIAVAPGGRTFATADKDGAVVLWPTGGPAAAAFPPLDAAWAAKVRALPPDEQVREVEAELKRRDPAWDGFPEPKPWYVRDGAVVGLTIRGRGPVDLTPVRALAGLRELVVKTAVVAPYPPGAVRDLSPLAGLPLTDLLLSGHPVADLRPLAGMPLRKLHLQWTSVTDLSPLAGMPLTELQLPSAACDPAPLAGLPLVKVGGLSEAGVAHYAAVLRAIPTLQTVDGRPATEVIGPARAAAVAPLATLAGPPAKNGLTCVAFSPDGRTLAAGANGGPVTLWDVAARRELRRLADSAERLLWSPDGATLLTVGYKDGRFVRGWDPTTGTERFAWPLPGEGHGLAFVDNGRTLTIGCGKYDTTEPAALARFAWPGGEPRPTVAVPGQGQVKLAATPGGRWLATHCGDAIHVWPATGDRPERTLDLPPRPFRVAISPAGDRLAATGRGGYVMLFDPATGRRVAEAGGGGAKYAFTFAPDGRLLTGDTAGEVAVYDGATLAALARYPGHAGSIRDIAVGPDGKLFATAGADGTVKLWPLDAPAAAAPPFPPLDPAWVAKVRALPPAGQVNEVSAELKRRNPDWDNAAGPTWSDKGGTVDQFGVFGVGLRDLTPVRSLPGLYHFSCDTAAAPPYPPGTLTTLTPLAGLPLTILALAGQPVADLRPLAGMPLKTLDLESTAATDLAPLSALPLSHLKVPAGATDLRPLGNCPLVTLGCPANVVLRNAAALRSIPTLVTLNDSAAAARVACEESRAAAPAVVAAATLVAPTGHGRVSAVAYAPDGRTVAAAGAGRPVVLWDADTGRERVRLTDTAAAVAWSPDGQTLLAVGGFDGRTVRGWDAATGRRRFAWPLPGVGEAVAFAPDGRAVLVGYANAGQAGVVPHSWPAGDALPAVDVGHGWRFRLAGSATGPRLAAISHDAVRVWPSHARTLNVRGRATAVAVAPAGDKLAASHGRGGIVVFDPGTGREEATTGVGDGHPALAYTRDGRLLAGDVGGEVFAFDAAGRTVVARYAGHVGEVLDIAVAPDGLSFATAGTDGTVKLWPLAARQ